MNHELQANSILSHYRILKKLGAGGMGEVYLAEDTRLGRNVALKILPPEFAGDEGRVRRFVLEAKAASALNHPNILTVYDIGDGEPSRYIATELVNGETLRNRLNGAPFSMREALDVTAQVASALNAAHEAGIIHRDIKPENIMVRPDGLVKVLDFGLAKLAAPVTGTVDSEAETLTRGLTRPGSILGTLRYMSPEQVRGQALDSRSDIFSLGAVLYERLAGAGLGEKLTLSDTIAAILMEPPPLDGLPPPLRDIVARSLRKERENRYQSSRDLLQDLKSVSRELDLSEQTGRGVLQTDEIGVSRTEEMATQATGALTARRFSLLQALAILLLAGLASAAMWLFFVRDRGESFSPASLKSVEITSWPSAPGEVYSVGSFSPDGKVIAFTAARSGSMNIWVKRTASGDALPVTNDDYANESPIWSPTGEEIAYFSIKGNHAGIWRTPAFGSSTPVLIATLQDGSAFPRRWSKNGSTIFYESKRNLYTLDVQSGQANQLTNLDTAKVNAESLSISPDEQKIAYISTADDGRSSVWLAPVSGGAARQIANDAGHNRNTVWHPDSQTVLYRSNIDGVYQIFAANIDGRKPVQLTFGDFNSFALDVSADGTRVLYGSTKEESDLWGVNIAK